MNNDETNRCNQCIFWKTPGLQEYCCKGCNSLKNYGKKELRKLLCFSTGSKNIERTTCGQIHKLHEGINH